MHTPLNNTVKSAVIAAAVKIMPQNSAASDLKKVHIFSADVKYSAAATSDSTGFETIPLHDYAFFISGKSLSCPTLDTCERWRLCKK